MIKNISFLIFITSALSHYRWVLIPWIVSFVVAVSQRTASATALALVGTIFLIYLMLGLRSQSPSQSIVIKLGRRCVVTAVMLFCLFLFITLQDSYPKVIFLILDDGLICVLLWILILFCSAYSWPWNKDNPSDAKIQKIMISGLLVFMGIFWIRMAYDVGFEKLFSYFDNNPERLRDITFKIWDTHSFQDHWGLSFFSLEDFEKKNAYAGHSLPYLLLLYAFNSLAHIWSSLSIRNIAVVEMMILICAIAMVVKNILGRLLADWRGALLVILGIGFCVTSPFYWISAGKANVDNVFFFHSGILVIVSYLMANETWRTRKITVLCIIFSALIAPVSSVLLGMYWLLYSARCSGKACKRVFDAGLWLIVSSIIVWAYAPLATHLAGFHSVSSTWAFRAGLDGDTYYFLNLFQAVVSPAYPRPFLHIATPLIILMLQLIVVRFYEHREKKYIGNKLFSNGMFLGGVGSTYVGTLAFWPQSISVHPYLYDFIGLLPIYIAILLNFKRDSISDRTWMIWILILAIAIQVNITSIAQAGKCPGCFPDLPTTCGIAISEPHYGRAGSCQF
jgi:hypothetical protein